MSPSSVCNFFIWSMSSRAAYKTDNSYNYTLPLENSAMLKYEILVWFDSAARP